MILGRAGEDRAHAAEQLHRPLEVGEADLGAVAVRPLALGPLDAAEHPAPGRRQAGQFRTAMARIRLVGDEPVAFEQIGDTLDALSGEPKAPGNLRDRPGAALEASSTSQRASVCPSDLASSSPVLVKYSASRITSTRTFVISAPAGVRCAALTASCRVVGYRS